MSTRGCQRPPPGCLGEGHIASVESGRRQCQLNLDLEQELFGVPDEARGFVQQGNGVPRRIRALSQPALRNPPPDLGVQVVNPRD